MRYVPNNLIRICEHSIIKPIVKVIGNRLAKNEIRKKKLLNRYQSNGTV